MILRRVSLLLTALMICCSSPALANDDPAARPGVDPKADQALRQMGKCLAEAKQFSFEARDMTDEVLDTGQKIHLSHTRRISVRRPDNVTVDYTGDTHNELAWYNGKTLTMLDKATNEYSVIEVPNNIDEMLDFVANTFGVVMPLADLLFSDPYKITIDNVRVGHYVGLHQVHGIKCHHLAFRQQGIDWQIWITASDRPVPRKLVISFVDYPGHPQFIALLGKWNLTPKFPDDLFTFKAPPDAKKIEFEPMRRQKKVDRILKTKDTKESP